jgi:hypothetical protein
MNFKEIIKAWTISFNPTELQKNLAEERGKICDECSSKLLIAGIMPLCKECGCPIGKKIFTDSYNPCSLKKWEKVDIEYFSESKIN